LTARRLTANVRNDIEDTAMPRHPRLPGAVIVSGNSGDDAHHYQERQIRHAIREATE